MMAPGYLWWMVDSTPQSGTVESLTSKFENMAAAISATNVSRKSAIEGIIRQSKLLNSEGLLEMVYLLEEAEKAESQEEFAAIGAKIQLLTTSADVDVANEAAAISETISAFACKLCSDQKSAIEHINFCKDSADYYLNRVRTEARKQGRESEWAKSVLDLFTALRESNENAVVHSKSESLQIKSVKSSTEGQKPLVSLQGNKWIIENGTSFAELVEIKPESMNQSVLIENCEKIMIKITGKVSAVAVNRCKRLKLEVADVVSSVEATSTFNTDFFLQGRAPTVVLDSSEGIRLYLNEPSRDAQILSSKCAEINVVVPHGLLTKSTGGEDSDDMVEIALPFQFKSILKADGSIVTEAVLHSAA